MSEWRRTIRCYVSPGGRNKIADWYANLSVQGKADADTFINNMRKLRRWEWPDYRSRIQGKKGLGELRWPSENKQNRLIGFFEGDVWYAVMGCTHKQQVYNPPNALDGADDRKKKIQRGEVSTVEYDL